MKEEYKKLSHQCFIRCIDELCIDLNKYLDENKLKIDYICPILRSGAVPATYIANKMNIVKFAPFQIKHITYKNNDDKIKIIFNPLDSLKIVKDKPVFLVVEALQSTGTSSKLCIEELKKKYKNVQVLYVCIAKEYGSPDFKDITLFSKAVFNFNGHNNFSKEQCKKMQIDYFTPLFPWETLELQLSHPDDLEENIFF